MRKAFAALSYGTITGLLIYAIQASTPVTPLILTFIQAGRYELVPPLLASTWEGGATFDSIALSILIGLNVGLILYFIWQRRAAPPSGIVGGVAGMIAGIFGIGCAACGSTLAIALFGAGSGTVVSALPYGGAWLGKAGLVILAISAVFLVRAIRKPLVCEI